MIERKDYKKEANRILDGLLEGYGLKDDDINTLNLCITLGWEFVFVYGGKKLIAEADITHEEWFNAFNLESFSIDEELIDRIKLLVTSADKIMFRINAVTYAKIHNGVIARLDKFIEADENENQTAEESA